MIQALEWQMMIARDQATQEWREIMTHRLLALEERLVQILAELKGKKNEQSLCLCLPRMPGSDLG